MADRNAQIVAVLTGVHSFYRVELSAFQARAWLRMLEGFEVEQVNRAFEAHMMDPTGGQFLPKPADVVKHLQGTQADRAALAWSKVLEAIQRVGGYATVAFDEAAIHCAIEDMGGWPAVCATRVDELPFVERRFCTAYRAHLKAGGAHPARLQGITDQTNAAGGYAAQAPVLIGNPEQCQAVIAAGSATHRAQITVQQIAGLLPGVEKETR
jgi:Domain of unknown function (DUF6475)